MKKIIIMSMAILLVVGCGKKKKENIKKTIYTNNFNIDLIKTVNEDKNYLISPYSIEVALNMLKEGTNNNTKEEIEKVIHTRNINNISTNNKIKIANALFIKNEYKDIIKTDFSNNLISKYKSEVLYDEFKTPDVINNWVDKHTDGMIKKIINEMDPDFVLGLANAIAIDVEWESPFECIKTTSEEFTKNDKNKINVEMMHNSYESSNYKYLKDDYATGIIIPYKSYDETNRLEFVGILPNDSVDNYINSLTKEKLDNLLNNGKEASSKFEIQLSLPRFKYEYEISDFKHVLKQIGINQAFDAINADFTNIMNKEDMKTNLYVSDAIHKTYIDLNEKGTKAAAVTYFGLKNYSAMKPEEKETVSIKFNKPFIYMIRDKQTEEMLFFGVVYEPNTWKDSTCENVN